jgi:type IV secretion system protein VirD4
MIDVFLRGTKELMRGMEISANVIVQNIAQLKAGCKETWEVIAGNCDSFLFLGGKEESTLKMVSELKATRLRGGNL